MKRILGILLFLSLGILYGNPTPTQTPTVSYNITAANALGLYTSGHNTYACYVTISAGVFTQAQFKQIDSQILNVYYSSDGKKIMFMVIGTQSQIIAIQNMSSVSKVLPVNESSIASQFPDFTISKNYLRFYLDYTP